MAEPRKTPEKTLTDRVKDALDGMLEVLDGLIRPEPAFVPVPVRVPKAAPRAPRRR